MKLIEEENLTIEHFHKLLNTIFHQVYTAGSSTLALAGVMTDNGMPAVREYLFHHAEEEQDHWKWIIQNLRDTGYIGPDPRAVFPSFPTQAYLSFAMHFSLKYPVESLAIAYTLEGLSSQLAVNYGLKAASQLNLTKEQMSFFILHGELDEGHEADLLDVLKNAKLTGEQWARAEYAAKATVHFYKEMYNYAAQL
jgi:heme oxygenase